MKQNLNLISFDLKPHLLNLPLPLFLSKVPCGFPSPADDYLEDKIDLNEYLIKKPSATFFVRVEGDSMIGAGIYPNDLVIVDRSLKATHGSVVLAILDGEFTIKRILFQNEEIILSPENEKHSPIIVELDQDFEIWGVVTSVIHKP